MPRGCGSARIPEHAKKQKGEQGESARLTGEES
jgi:hypothetical protein